MRPFHSYLGCPHCALRCCITLVSMPGHGFNPMLLPKLDRREIPRSRDRGNFYRSNPGSPSIRSSGSCLRLCRVVFACYTPTGGSRPTPAGAGQVVKSKYILFANYQEHNYCVFLPGIILLTECYYHRGTRLNAMKRFCVCSL